MNLRTLTKGDTMHIVNISCMLLAWSATGFYYEPTSPDKSITLLGQALLTPVALLEQISGLTGFLNPAGSPIKIFLVLWISYLLTSLRLSSFLIVKNHDIAALKNWYLARKAI